MLFTFNYFWKFLVCLISAWVFYGFFGYEIAVITLLSILVAFNLKDTRRIL